MFNKNRIYMQILNFKKLFMKLFFKRVEYNKVLTGKTQLYLPKLD